jgi:outer membrane lipoprotein-sorting protein
VYLIFTLNKVFMKNIGLILFLSFVTVFGLTAQTVDEILSKYYENVGGKEAWKELQATRTIAKVRTQGLELPAVLIQTKDGKQKVSINFQGMEIVQPCFDGQVGWQTNFMTMKAEKMESEDNEIMKSSTEDFPDAFLEYAEKGYSLTLEGIETVEGTDCFKLMLTKKPLIVDGKEEPNINYWYFEKENFVPILYKSSIPKGPAKGMMTETVLSDYQEINGLLFPFTIEQKVNGTLQATISVEKIELNPTIDQTIFSFPADK